MGFIVVRHVRNILLEDVAEVYDVPGPNLGSQAWIIVPQTNNGRGGKGFEHFLKALSEERILEGDVNKTLSGI